MKDTYVQKLIKLKENEKEVMRKGRFFALFVIISIFILMLSLYIYKKNISI